ncbi:ribonuclease H-like domain-containing protein, partial [Tanacetum coccineum]
SKVGSVTFGGSKGSISGKGTIRLGNLVFDDVAFVKELGHFNLFSISQICDKKLNVLFTEKECFVVSADFKMTDENQVLLKVPRQHNMYTFDMKNVASSKGYTCLLAKASSDEAKLWHRRLGHLNFKNLNKLVKDNLVRGLPSKSFKNDHTCVACQKGKQHKASCKAKIDRFVTHPLHTLHMDLQEFSNARTPQQNGVAERMNRTLIEAARTMLADSHLPTTFWAEAVNTACYTFNRGIGHRWMFDLDYLTDSMNYIPVSLQNQANPAGSKEVIDIDVQTEEAADLMVVSSTSLTEATRKAAVSEKIAILKEHLGPVPTKAPTSTIPVNTGSGNLNTGKEQVSPGNMETVSPSAQNEEEVFSDDNEDEMPEIRIYDKSSEGIFEQASYDDDGVITDFNNLPDTCEPRKVTEALEDGSWVEAMQEELLQFKLQQVWVLVDLPYGAKVIDKKKGNDYDRVFAPGDRIEAIRNCTIDEEVPSKSRQNREGHLHISGQVTPKTSHSIAVKRSFNDYGGSNLDRKSTTGGCQFLGQRLISWQCKKQTIVATSTTEAEYVAAAHCCGQVLWVQNQLLDYGFNFMNTKIHIDNESTICIVKNPVYHSKTKHIEIRHHFIRDCYEKKLISVEKIHTDLNVADLLTKPFDGPRFNYLVVSIGLVLVLLGVEKGDARSTWTWKRKCQLSLANWMQFGMQNMAPKVADGISCSNNALLESSSTGKDFNFSKLIYMELSPISKANNVNPNQCFSKTQPPCKPEHLLYQQPTHHVPTLPSIPSHVQITQPPPSLTQPVQSTSTPPIQPVGTSSTPPIFTISDTQPTFPPSPQIPSPSYHDTEDLVAESEQLRNPMNILREQVKKLENKLRKKRKRKETEDAEGQNQEVPSQTDQENTYATILKRVRGSGEAQEDKISRNKRKKLHKKALYGNEALASPKANELTIPEQTATGKGTSNPFMAGSLPKTTKPT